MDQTPRHFGREQCPDRLSPAMVSQRLLVLAFVRSYIERYHVGPSQGEIANGLGIGRSAVRNALRSLERDELIVRGRGPRGLTLPSRRDEAIRQLLALGWEWDHGVLHSPSANPHLPLPERIVLDYP